MLGCLFPWEASAQSVIFDDEIVWEWPTADNVFGGYGFFWFHRLDGITMPHYGEMPTSDWTTPADYYNGQFRLRFEVLEQPTEESFKVQFGIWQDRQKGEAHPLTVSNHIDISTCTVFEGSLGLPATWYNKEGDDKVDFIRPEDFFRMGLILWNRDPLCIPQGTDWDPNGCPGYAEKYFPMRARVSITAYSSSETFPPSYSIDYENEQTAEQVMNNHEWSSDSANWIDGENDFLQLTPGQDLYFRVKADQTKVQVLDVKERPETPAFTIDYFSEATAEPVSNATWFSANSNMRQADEGTGNPVALLPGSTLYFQTRWTSITFRSEIQALTIPSRPPPPEYSLDYWNEMTFEIVQATIEYTDNAGMNGAVPGSDSTVRVTPGENLYFRRMATSSSFASDIHILNSPPRPLISSEETDTMINNPFIVSVVFFQEASNLRMTGITAINAIVNGLQLISSTETSALYQASLSPITSGIVSLRVLANAVDEGNFASDSFIIHYRTGTGSTDPVQVGTMTLNPNPTSGKIVVTSPMLKLAGTIVKVYSLTGSVLITELPDDQSGSMGLELESLARGIYFLKLTSTSGSVAGKVVVR